MLDEGKASWHLKGLCCLARGGRRKRGRRGACLASRRKKARKSIIEEEATFLRLAERSKKGRDLKNFLCRRLRRLWCALQQNSPTNFVYEGPTTAAGGTGLSPGARRTKLSLLSYPNLRLFLLFSHGGIEGGNRGGGAQGRCRRRLDCFFVARAFGTTEESFISRVFPQVARK